MVLAYDSSLSELRQMDIPQKARYSDGKQNAQNDQRNHQLYKSKAAFSALFCAAVSYSPPPSFGYKINGYTAQFSRFIFYQLLRFLSSIDTVQPQLRCFCLFSLIFTMIFMLKGCRSELRQPSAIFTISELEEDILEYEQYRQNVHQRSNLLALAGCNISAERRR